uniref:Uncharacterized protein n=1 Tax=Anguilla anguilla TaxID=7936 RepID=A0A0E9UDM3_ANGAN
MSSGKKKKQQTTITAGLCCYFNQVLSKRG